MIKTVSFLLLVGVLLAAPFKGVVFAQLDDPVHKSTNYGIDQYGFGAGGENEGTSASFNSQSFIGDLGIGNSTSSNFQANAGFVTTGDPYLEFAVDEETIDMGLLDSVTTGTGDATFRIRTYLASGYTVTVAGPAPTYSGYEITSLAAPAASSAGTEQFGMNLVANTSPVAQGAAPQQNPDATFSFGTVDASYNTADVYMYETGDIVASSNSSSGETQFTASFIMNVNAATTPAGFYQTRLSFIAVPTY